MPAPGPAGVAADIAAADWSATPLGPRETWPRSLHTILDTVLGSRFSMWMGWGPDLTFFCNDAYRRDTLGAKYPWALGKPAREVWSEIWIDIGPRIESVLRDGVATWDESLLLYLERSGYREETYHTFSYSPLAGDDGARVGMLCVVVEETERVIAERRLSTLQALSSALAGVDDEAELWATATETLAARPEDLPFVLAYRFGDDGPELVAATGIDPARAGTWPLAAALAGEEAVVDLAGREGLPRSGVGDVPAQAVVLPLGAQADGLGALVVGVSPNRPLDEAVLGFVRLVAGQLSASLGAAHAFEDERRRSEALAALDRAKTEFFANVSHEFRTPLTLITGPLAELREAAVEHGDEDGLANLDIVHRNAVRLGKLVNALLDFSRLRAGRQQADLTTMEVGPYTAELAEMFRPAIERAGLSFTVDAPELGRPVLLDTELWEKVVFNLLSNALKFTFDGGVTVRVRAEDDAAVVEVADTGTGIPPTELPKLFERFHRVPESRSRSREGSGIGLALAAESVELHGGTIGAASDLGSGTTFTIRLPWAPRAMEPAAAAPSGAAAEVAAPYLAEAWKWLAPDDAEEPPEEAGDPAVGAGPLDQAAGADILVVDDNPDMRAYLRRLLGDRHRVRTAANGQAALAAVAERRPDLVVSDVMMPEVDGVELVRRLRADPQGQSLPIILLSAQAGSEATGAGLDVGADDYLVKPFGAADLLARVAARLASGRERQQRDTLAQLSLALEDAPDAAGVAAEAHAFLAATLGTSRVTLAVADPDGRGVALVHHPPPAGDERRTTLPADAEVPVVAALRGGEPVILSDPDAIAARFPRAAATLLRAGVAAELALPVPDPAGGAAAGVAIAWAEPHDASGAEIALAERAAERVGRALARVHASEQEHRIVREFQERLLEVHPQSTLGVVGVRYRPAERSLVVGGDWYDVHALPHALGVSVGDVVGKGLVAATVMSQLRSALGVSATSAASTADAMTMLDAYARQLPDALCATAVLAVLDVHEGSARLRWTSAGHPAPVVVDGNGPAGFATGGRRRPLAALAPDAGPEGSVRLGGASLVLLHSDGLIERRGEPLDVGAERLRAAVGRLGHLPIDDLLDRLIDELAPPEGFGDDVAIVGVRTAGAHPAHYVDAFPAEPVVLAPARARLRDWLATTSLGAGEREDVLLATHEAMSNAIEHGSRFDARDVVGVEIGIDDEGGRVHAAVTDAGAWADTADPADDLHRGHRGRGLSIIEGTMDAVRVSTGRIGTTVSMERAIR